MKPYNYKSLVGVSYNCHGQTKVLHRGMPTTNHERTTEFHKFFHINRHGRTIITLGSPTTNIESPYLIYPDFHIKKNDETEKDKNTR